MAKRKFTLGGFIAEEREKLNLSQVELAKKCKIPAGTIASVESGYAKSPRSVTLKKIAEGLNIPFEIIFKFASTPEKELYVELDRVELIKLPNLGQIPSEDILLSFDEAKNYVSFPADFVEDGDFLLSVSGDHYSHEDIFDNDYIVIKNQDFLKRSGDLMVIKLDGIITLLRVYKYQDGYKLNNSSKDIIVKSNEISFLGKAVTSISRRKL